MQTTIDSPTIDADVAEERTDRVDAVGVLEAGRHRHLAPARPIEPGRYLQVQEPGEPRLFGLPVGVMHVGRGLAADLRLDEASVSRRHAILVSRHHSTWVLDDRSSNGTYVNGRRLSQTELRDGDVLVLGRVRLRYLEV